MAINFSRLKGQSIWLLLLLIFNLSTRCYAQKTSVDKVLSLPVYKLDSANFKLLIKSGYLKKSEAALLGSYLLSTATKGKNLKSLTVKQALNNFRRYIKQTNAVTAVANNYGKDSVFIRMPDGGKVFLGMGKMSLNKLIARESRKLPLTYRGALNNSLADSKSFSKLIEMIPNYQHSWLAGNVLMNYRANRKITQLRIGDIFEIADRIAASVEFQPFMKQMEK